MLKDAPDFCGVGSVVNTSWLAVMLNGSEVTWTEGTLGVVTVAVSVYPSAAWLMNKVVNAATPLELVTAVTVPPRELLLGVRVIVAPWTGIILWSSNVTWTPGGGSMIGPATV